MQPSQCIATGNNVIRLPTRGLDRNTIASERQTALYWNWVLAKGLQPIQPLSIITNPQFVAGERKPIRSEFVADTGQTPRQYTAVRCLLDGMRISPNDKLRFIPEKKKRRSFEVPVVGEHYQSCSFGTVDLMDI